MEEATAQLEKYRARMYKPTSRSDLKYMLDNAVKIVTYDELLEYKTLQELLSPYQSVIILYPNNQDPEIGHWCCIFVIPGTDRLEYFDSYGCYIDSMITDDEDEDILHKPTKIEPKLLKLLIESPYGDNVWWNETAFQSTRLATATCGLWVVLRLKNNHMTEDQFKKLYYDGPTAAKILPDLMVSTIICDMYPEMAKQ